MDVSTLCEGFTPAHMVALAACYEGVLDDLGYSPVRFPAPAARVAGSVASYGRFECLNHAYWACTRIPVLVEQSQLSAARQLIGMVQGMLFMGGVFSLDDIQGHARRVPGRAELAVQARRTPSD
jgi:hypothetical protein